MNPIKRKWELQRDKGEGFIFWGGGAASRKTRKVNPKPENYMHRCHVLNPKEVLAISSLIGLQKHPKVTQRSKIMSQNTSQGLTMYY